MRDPDIDFSALMGRFDTFLIGRKTFEMMQRMGNAAPAPGIQNIVFSRTLARSIAPPERSCATMRSGWSPICGPDPALYGGGELFRSVLSAGLVDELHFSVIPVLLGGGIPMLPPPANGRRLKLKKHRVYEKTGTVGLEYAILRP